MNRPPSPEETLFAAALLRETPAERAAYLDGACAGDPGLRHRVEELLRASADAATFLESPAARPPGGTADAATVGAPPPASALEGPGARIGRYKLLQQIGEGGCGTVFMAEQEEPVRRRVALKVIKLGMDTRSVVARFEAERQALAMMDHPNIAKVLDAGATDSGRPFFVMELVRGIPITRYCDENKLGTQQRLDLFIRVCHAIQHAHQKGIIHRDIKPSNILVALHDGTPVPKVIDFGIAKATEGPLTDATVYTRLHQFMGTPAYMSPEQAEMTGLDIDTRADVYSLGVVLYELLTGATPLDATELASSGLDELRKIIRERDPLRPSTRLARDLARGTTAPAPGPDRAPAARNPAAAPGDPAELRRRIALLRGDLDWIVLRCLEKDRIRRYESADALAADLRRHLDDEPVLARPPGTAYRMGKFARRHRGALAAAAVVLLALVAGVAGTALALLRALDAEQEQRRLRGQAEAALDSEAWQRRLAATNEFLALRAARRAEALADFLVRDVLGAADPWKRGREVRLAEALDSAARTVDSALAREPDVQAAVRSVLAEGYAKLGLPADAEPHARAAYGQRLALLGAEAPETIEARAELGRILRSVGRAPEAVAELAAVAEALSRQHGPRHPRTVRARLDVADARQAAGEIKAGADLAAEVLDGQSATPDNLELPVETVVLAGKILAKDNRLEAAGAVLTGALERRDRTDAAPGQEELTILNELSGICLERGDFAGAEAHARRSLGLSRQVLGDGHPDTAAAANALGNALMHQRKHEEAGLLRRQALDILTRRLGPDHRSTMVAANNLASTLRGAGQPGEAARLHAENLERRRRVLGPHDADVGESLEGLAMALSGLGRPDEAIPLFEEARDIVRKQRGPEDVNLANILANLAKTLLQAGRLAEAEQDLRELIALERKVLGPTHPYLLDDQRMLATVRRRRDHPAEAETLIREVLRVRRQQPDHDLVSLAADMLEQAACLKDLGRLDDAEAAVHEVLRLVAGEDHATQPRDAAQALARQIEETRRQSAP